MYNEFYNLYFDCTLLLVYFKNEQKLSVRIIAYYINCKETVQFISIYYLEWNNLFFRCTEYRKQ